MKIDKEQNQKALKIEKKKRGSCAYCMVCIVIVVLFKVPFMPVSSCKHFAFCDSPSQLLSWVLIPCLLLDESADV